MNPGCLGVTEEHVLAGGLLPFEDLVRQGPAVDLVEVAGDVAVDAGPGRPLADLQADVVPGDSGQPLGRIALGRIERLPAPDRVEDGLLDQFLGEGGIGPTIHKQPVQFGYLAGQEDTPCLRVAIGQGRPGLSIDLLCHAILGFRYCRLSQSIMRRTGPLLTLLLDSSDFPPG